MKILPLALALGCVTTVVVFSGCDDDAAVAPADAGAADGPTTSSSGSPPTGPSGGPADCAALADAQCRRLERCMPLFVHAYVGALSDCKERYTIICERSTKAPGASAFTASCAAAYDDPSCDADVITPCGGTGGLADGAPCEFGRQCTSGNCAGVGGSEFCGTCKPASGSFNAAGEACDNDDCGRGLSCIGFKTTPGGDQTRGKCEPTRTLGQPCDDAEDCHPGGACSGDACALGYGLACLEGKCATPLGDGAKCPPTLAGPVCDVRKELFCTFVATGATCTKIVLANEGEACKNTEGPATGACGGTLRCTGSGAAAKCVPKPLEGATCTDDDECRLGAACIAGVCAIAPADRCK